MKSSQFKQLVDKIEQVVRLIRSKGIGVYFISQSPLDIPEDIMGQLGTKIQHALRAFTPKDKKMVRMVADTFRENPKVDTRTAITELKTGEALVSVLAEDGSPTPVERILIAPPGSRIGPLNVQERQEVINRSPLKGRYDEKIDRESAYEILKKRAEEEKRLDPLPTSKPSSSKSSSSSSTKKRPSNRQSYLEATAKSMLRSLGSSLGRQIVRGIMKTIMGK